MFANTLLTLAVAALAAASPVARRGDVGECNTGSLQCCNTVAPASDLSPATLAGLLGVVISGLDVVVGLECTSIPIVGIDASNTWCVSPRRFRSS